MLFHFLAAKFSEASFPKSRNPDGIKGKATYGLAQFGF